MRVLLLFIFISLLMSCSKAPANWDTQVSTPLVRATLGLDNLVADSLIQINDDQSVGIRLKRDILTFKVDSLVEIPADTVERKFSISPLASFTLNPGQTFYQTNDEFEFNSIEAQLSEAIIKNGILKFHAENTIPNPLDFVLEIPGASLNGVVLQIETTVPGSSSGQNGILNFEIDLTNYTLDLTGTSQYGYNSLSVNFRLTIPQDGGTVTVFNPDFVKLQLTYSGLEVAYAKGYLGTINQNVKEGSSLSDFKKFNEAILDLENSTAELIFSNGFGVDIQAHVSQIKGWNTSKNTSLSLQSSFIGNTINLSRASYPSDRIIPFEKFYLLDNGNSNLDEMLELLPDSIQILANIDVNPFGNISNYNDFVSYESTIKCAIDAYIPLTLSLSNLTLRDTAAFEFTDDDTFVISDGKLFVVAANGFPANIKLSLQALDENNMVLINLDNYLEGDGLIIGRTDNTPKNSILKYSLNEAVTLVLKQATKIAITADFETTNYPDRITFTSNDSLNILISADINSTINF